MLAPNSAGEHFDFRRIEEPELKGCRIPAKSQPDLVQWCAKLPVSCCMHLKYHQQRSRHRAGCRRGKSVVVSSPERWRQCGIDNNGQGGLVFLYAGDGLDLGLEAVGLHPTLANEVDSRFCETIRLNRPALDLVEGDIASLTGRELGLRRCLEDEVFLMVGGPPCQPFSSGGRRAALNDPRGNLIYEYFRLISEVSPRYFVLANVAQITTAALRHRPIAERQGRHWSLKQYNGNLNRPIDGMEPLAEEEMSGSGLKKITRDAQSLGYSIAFSVVDAADYGTPQHRLRFVMIGSKEHPPPVMPAASHGDGKLDYATVRDAIWDVQDVPGPHSSYTDVVRRYFDLVPEGGNWRSLPSELQEEALGGS